MNIEAAENLVVAPKNAILFQIDTFESVNRDYALEHSVRSWLKKFRGADIVSVDQENILLNNKNISTRLIVHYRSAERPGINPLPDEDGEDGEDIISPDSDEKVIDARVICESSWNHVIMMQNMWLEENPDISIIMTTYGTASSVWYREIGRDKHWDHITYIIWYERYLNQRPVDQFSPFEEEYV